MREFEDEHVQAQKRAVERSERKTTAGTTESHLQESAELEQAGRKATDTGADQHVAPNQWIAPVACQQPTPGNNAFRPVSPDQWFERDIEQPHEGAAEQGVLHLSDKYSELLRQRRHMMHVNHPKHSQHKIEGRQAEGAATIATSEAQIL